MVRFSRVWRTLLRMGHPQVKWLVWLMTHDGLMPAQLQGDEGGVGALPRNRVECGTFSDGSLEGTKNGDNRLVGRAWGNAHLGVGFCPHFSRRAGANLAPRPCL